MTEWITDRLPTEEDADHAGHVWDSEAYTTLWEMIEPNEPWMPTNRPKPYVKPKRWQAEFTGLVCPCWEIIDGALGHRFILPFPAINDDKHREAAERIAEIVNEVTP